LVYREMLPLRILAVSSIFWRVRIKFG
jgi:hypothetical protein